MAAMQEITCKCGCGRKKMVRTADLKRGWGLFFDKSCKAKYQSRTGGSSAYYSKRNKYKDKQTEFGGNPEFNRHGEYVGFTLSMEDMAEDNVQ